MFSVSSPAVVTKPAGPEGAIQFNHNGAFDGGSNAAGYMSFNTAATYPTDNIVWVSGNPNPNVGVSFTLGTGSSAALIVGGGVANSASVIKSYSDQGLFIDAPNAFLEFAIGGGASLRYWIMAYSGSFIVSHVGAGLQVAEGANGMQGVATLVGGTVTVGNTNIAANSRIFLTSQVDGGTPGWLRVSGRTNGTSFTITSSSVLDTSTVAYEIFAPPDQAP